MSSSKYQSWDELPPPTYGRIKRPPAAGRANRELQEVHEHSIWRVLRRADTPLVPLRDEG